MCMCGGIIEAGIITALIGYIGKKIHKCKCDCHEKHLHKCKHCSDDKVKKEVGKKTIGNWIITEYMAYNIHRFNKKKMFYKFVQYFLGILILGGLIFSAIGICKIINEHKHHNCMEINCEHNRGEK